MWRCKRSGGERVGARSGTRPGCPAASAPSAPIRWAGTARPRSRANRCGSAGRTAPRCGRRRNPPRCAGRRAHAAWPPCRPRRRPRRSRAAPLAAMVRRVSAKLGLHEDVARAWARCRPAGRRGRAVAAQLVGRDRPVGRHPVVHRPALGGEADRRLQQLVQPLGAVRRQQRLPRADRAGHGHGVRPGVVDRGDPLAFEPVDRGRRRRPARTVQRHHRLAGLLPQAEAVAADARSIAARSRPAPTPPPRPRPARCPRPAARPAPSASRRAWTSRPWRGSHRPASGPADGDRAWRLVPHPSPAWQQRRIGHDRPMEHSQHGRLRPPRHPRGDDQGRAALPGGAQARDQAVDRFRRRRSG